MSKTVRAVLLTDLHIRCDYLPGYLSKQLSTLTRMVNTKPPEYVIINGDIFHKRNPKGEELLAFRNLLKSFKCQHIIINRGNHDTIRKDGSSESTLSLFEDLAKIVVDTETVRIGGVDFDIIPHYEDERKIIADLKGSTNPVFGHFGYDRCLANSGYPYDSFVKASHFKDRLVFLGHIHKPQIKNNIYILGTQYSTSFGEANAQKYIHELLIRDGVVEVIRKPIEYGIKHLVCSPSTLESLAAQHNFSNFYTILRIKLDHLDSALESKIGDSILKRYPVNHLEFTFEDVLPKFDSTYSPSGAVTQLDDTLISKYLDDKTSVFSKQELLDTLDEIRSYENK